MKSSVMQRSQTGMRDRELVMVSKGSDVSAAAGHTRHTHVKLDLSSTKMNTTAQRKTIKIQSLKTQTSQNQTGENLQIVPGDCWCRQCCLLFVAIFKRC